MQPFQICIGPIIRIGRESWCLPYAGFFSSALAPAVSSVSHLAFPLPSNTVDPVAPVPLVAF